MNRNKSGGNTLKTRAGIRSECFLNVFDFLAPTLSSVCFTISGKNVRMIVSLNSTPATVSLNSTDWAILGHSNLKTPVDISLNDDVFTFEYLPIIKYAYIN